MIFFNGGVHDRVWQTLPPTLIRKRTKGHIIEKEKFSFQKQIIS
jgi:hypothetical protein